MCVSGGFSQSQSHIKYSNSKVQIPNFKVVGQIQAEFYTLKVRKLDVCIRPLFANPATYDERYLTVHIPCTQIALEESTLLHGVPSATTAFRITIIKFFSAERQTSWLGVTPSTMKFKMNGIAITVYAITIPTCSCIFLPGMQNAIEWMSISSCTLLTSKTRGSL